MVTITYEALNDLVHEVADAIEKTTGLSKETFNLFELNDAVTAYLAGYGVQYEDEVGKRPEPFIDDDGVELVTPEGRLTLEGGARLLGEEV